MRALRRRVRASLSLTAVLQRGLWAKAPNIRTTFPERRKVDRPPYARLKREVAAMGWSAVGRRYGVSDNAVRKWVRWYEEEMARQADGMDEVAAGMEAISAEA